MMKNKLTINQYHNLFLDDFDGLYSKMIHRLSIMNNCDPVFYDDYSSREIINQYKKIKWVETEINESHSKKELKLEDINIQLIDFKKLKFGQFIDLEHFINNNHINNIHKIVAILYLNYTKKKFESIEYEDYYKVDIDERAEYFLDNIYINDVLGNVNKYLKFRTQVFKSYPFFEGGLDDIDVDELNEEELKIYKEEKAKLKKDSKNIWEDILSMVTDGDLTKFEEILDTNVFLVFNRVQRLIEENKKKSKNQKTNNH